MAYVMQKSIKVTVLNAIDYIKDKKKTEDEKYVSSYKCNTDKKIALKEFNLLKKQFAKEDGILAHHFIQSFKPGEVDAETAHEVGIKWADKFLNGNYQYIISTHIDKDHIHNHIIANSVGLNGKKFNSCRHELEDIRTYSDVICREYGLSVIEPKYKTKYRSYKEWLESKNKTSWKDTVREDIDFAISSSSSFEDFIQKMKSEGYYIKHGSNVKYMTFQKSGMKKTVRGKILGEDYSEESIKERIKYKEFNISHLKSKEYKKYKVDRNSLEFQVRKLTYRSTSLNTSIKLIILLFKVIFHNNQLAYKKNDRPVKYTYAQKKAINGIKDLTNSLNLLDKYNLKTRSDVKNVIQNLNQKISLEDSKLKKLESLQVKSAAVMIEIEMYFKYKKYYEEYQSSILKSAYKKKHEYELGKFEACKDRLNKFGLKESEFKKFKSNYEKITVQLEAVQEEKEKIFQELFEVEILDKYLDNRKREEILKEATLERTINDKNEKER
jgi:hypothetical protein